MSIRLAEPADLPALGRLGALLVRAHHDFDPARFLAATPDTERAYAAFPGTQLQAPNVLVLVAERNGEVLGYTYAGVQGHDDMALRGPVGVLHDIVVDPAHGGHGAGRMLLDVTLAALEVRGVPRAVLVTVERGSWRKHELRDALHDGGEVGWRLSQAQSREKGAPHRALVGSSANVSAGRSRVCDSRERPSQ